MNPAYSGAERRRQNLGYQPERRRAHAQDANRDPITGTPGAHPVGVGLGAAAGGMATGAAVGTVAGPVGTAVGAAVGAIAGGLAGKGIAEKIDPTVEETY
jgi:phage tail tape-measure protein